MVFPRRGQGQGVSHTAHSTQLLTLHIHKPAGQDWWSQPVSGVGGRVVKANPPPKEAGNHTLASLAMELISQDGVTIVHIHLADPVKSENLLWSPEGITSKPDGHFLGC